MILRILQAPLTENTLGPLSFKVEEKTLPRLIQTGESASSFLTSDAFRHRGPSDVSEARSEASWLRAGSALRIKMAGHQSK